MQALFYMRKRRHEMNITGKQIVEAFQEFLRAGYGYVYGRNGELYTKEMAEDLHRKAKVGIEAVPQGRNKNRYFRGDCDKWIGKRVADCSGGIVAAMRKHDPNYGDRSSYGFYEQAAERGSIKSIPEIPGLAVWRKGHIGIYIGGGEVIEFRGTDYGCVKTKLKSRDFTHWLKLAGVTYEKVSTAATAPTKSWKLSRLLKRTKPLIKGDDVKTVQRSLVAKGYSCGRCGVDGQFGDDTVAAVKCFQKASGLVVDGIVGKNTCRALGGTWTGK